MPTTLKRTAATIGVLASVLAAAAPANATPDVGPRGNDAGPGSMKAAGTQVGSEGVIAGSANWDLTRVKAPTTAGYFDLDTGLAIWD